ncbi:MAG TPA: DUF2252 domain-containing protein [Acidimicrobiia bacterium]
MTAPHPIEHPKPHERAARGRAARGGAPRGSHAGWDPSPSRRGPVAILQEQATSRLQELVPIRHARMTASPFAFYRGAAAVMAADLATTPSSGIRVQCCGDAHLANFGGFAAPDRMLVFDVNDFDETLPGPWEWDVKRLLASFEIAARAREFDRKTRARIVEGTARAYRAAMNANAAHGNLNLWYARLDEAGVHQIWDARLGPEASRRLQKNLTKSRGKDSLRALSKLTTPVDGERRIVSDPPLIVRLEDLLPADVADQARSTLHEWFRGYRQSLQPDRRHLLESYELVDVARKVVGVGSVGTRCWIAYLQGRDEGDPLFLQIKEAEASVLEPHVGKSAYQNHGRRVVEGQRFTQSSSDIFLGWDRAPGLAGDEHDFYVRQLWDGKLSAQIDLMEPDTLEIYGEICASTLARAHARSGDAIAIAAYLGTKPVFDRAVTEFASAYAEQNQRDYEAVVAAIGAGELPVDRSELPAA